jgi:hypothetical protein
MSDKSFDVEYLEVGDSFEGGPIEQSYFIGAVMAAGGEVEIHGDKVFILQLPKKETPKAKAPVAPEPVVEKAPEPVVKAVVVKEEPEMNTPELDDDADRVVAELKAASTPKPAAKPGPKPKAAPAPEAEKE